MIFKPKAVFFNFSNFIHQQKNKIEKKFTFEYEIGVAAISRNSITLVPKL